MEQYYDIVDDGYYIQIVGTGDYPPADSSNVTVITLKSIYGRNEDPIVQHSENAFTVAYTDHADFNGTLEYIKKTHAKKVFTDSTRGGADRAIQCANEIKRKLNIFAEPIIPNQTNHWGT